MRWVTHFGCEMAERLETQERTNRGLMYRVFGQMADPPDEAVPVLAQSLSARLRIPPKEIKRRMKVAKRGSGRAANSPVRRGTGAAAGGRCGGGRRDR